MSGTKAFPLEALPEWLGSYVASVARAYQVPVDMPAAFALGVMATAAARLGSINPFAEHFEPLNLFVALVAPPGQKKSACIKALFRPVEDFERELQHEFEPERRRRALERERLERELETAKRDGHWDSAGSLAEQLAESPLPIGPQLLTADVTAQKLMSLLAEQQHMALVSAEPSMIPTMLGRWSKGDPELDVFLQGHAGDRIRVDRLGRASETVDDPRLTIVVALQPEALRKVSERPEAVGRGLLARFLFVFAPDVRGTERLRNGASIPAGHRQAFEVGVRAMFRTRPFEAPLRLDDEATDEWERFHDGFCPRMRPGGDMRELHGWGEKFRGQVARIAGCLHLAEFEGSEAVTADTMRRAIAIGEWLEGHLFETFGRLNLRADVREANEILEVIIREEWETFTRRQLHQALKDRTRFKRSGDLRRGLGSLLEAGWLTTRPDPDGKPGRPSVVYDVHPEVHSEGFEGVSGGLQ